MTVAVEDILGSEGALSRVVSHYVERPEQTRMALDIYDSVGRGVPFLNHGPTGIGKTIAALVACGLLARERDQRLLYVTKLINLQHQVIQDDLPDVARAFRLAGLSEDPLASSFVWRDLARDDPRRWLPFTHLKGARNYVCEREIEKTRESLEGRSARQVNPEIDRGQLRELLDWTSDCYDRSDLPETMDVSPELWELVSLGSGACRGRACKLKPECRFVAAKSRAMNARVVVINYASLFTSIAMSRLYGGQSILDRFELVIADEAHGLEAEARRFLGFDLYPRQVFRAASKLRSDHKRLRESLGDEVTSVFEVARNWASEADTGSGTSFVRRAHGHIRPRLDLERLVELVGEAIRAYVEEADETEDEEREVDLRRGVYNLASARDCLTEFRDLESESRVYYVQGDRERSCHLVAELLDPSEVLPELLWGQVEGVVLMSATLASGEREPFRRVVEHLGLPPYRARTSEAYDVDDPHTEGERYSSPFDWAENATLLVPADCPPADDDERVADSVAEVVRRVGGGVLVLTTRWSAVNIIADRLESEGDGEITILRQRPGGSRAAVVQAFRDDEDSVLVGTASLWTGVDVPGRALRCVVLTKLFFPSPSEPYIQGLEDRVKRRKNEAHASGNVSHAQEFARWSSFNDCLVPECETRMQQGVGRALRSEQCRAAIVILDDRVIRKRYGPRLLRALPPGLIDRWVGRDPIVERDWDVLDRFFDEV